tara:strand:+ start:871 stop:1143 length:273 start_codon:yes stop_codon:yes gene_type:complete
MFWRKNKSERLRIQVLQQKVDTLEQTVKSLVSAIEIINNRLDKHVEFISSVSKTNSLILKILDFQNSPEGKNNDDVKFLGFVYDEDEEEK